MMSFGNELMLIDATASINFPHCSFLLMDFSPKRQIKNTKVHSSMKRNALEGLMKHLRGCFESQSFSWSVIQSVSNHSNFLISNHGHGSFLRDVLPQQPVEVFIAASLSACKRSGKVSRALKLFINLAVSCKLFAIVIGQCFHPSCQRPELVHND